MHTLLRLRCNRSPLRSELNRGLWRLPWWRWFAERTVPDRRARLHRARQMADVVSADINLIKQLLGVTTSFIPQSEVRGMNSFVCTWVCVGVCACTWVCICTRCLAEWRERGFFTVKAYIQIISDIISQHLFCFDASGELGPETHPSRDCACVWVCLCVCLRVCV